MTTNSNKANYLHANTNPELMDDVAMNMCNNHNKLDYEVAPTLFLEFHGTQDSVKSQAESVGKQMNYVYELRDTHIFADIPGEIVLYNGGSQFRWGMDLHFFSFLFLIT